MRTPFLGTTLLLLGTASPAALTTSAAAQDLPAPDPVTCEDWGSYDFFAWASADTVASCLRAGADPVAPLDESRGTPLHHAARATPDPAVIAVLVQAGADPNAPDLNGGTPLHEAARSNSNPGIIAALLEAGADLDAPDSRGNTPLHSAWSNPRAGLSWQPPRINPAAVQELLRSGADPLARNDNGLVADPTSCELWHTPVFALAADFAIYASCLESGADIGATDDNGNTVLHHSASNPDPAITTLLLGVGAGARTLNGAGTTPLHIATQHENLEVVATLLEAGVEVNATNDRGTTPLHGAARNESPAVVLALLEAGADLNARTSEGATPLVTAMGGMGRGAKPAIVDALLEAGADVNIPETFFGRTPLHESMSGTPADSVNGITLKLLAHGADPNARSRFGGTPLHTAAYEHGPAVIRVLVEAGADPNVLDDDGESPLHPAARYGRPGTITALVNAGTDPNTANEDGEAPLHQAVSEGKTANVDALLEGGADANARTARGDTPLHLAAAPPDTTIVSALVNAGADVNARNLSGETPLHAAWQHDSPMVIGKLLELGADPEAEDDRGRIAGPTCDWGDYDFFRDAPVESVRGCVEVGTPIDSRDRVGRPLLHRLGGSLFSRGDVTIAIASLLLEAGADVNERDDRGSTPLHYAAGGTSDFVAALLEAGADVNARSSFGDTPLHRAAAGRNDRDTNISLLVRAGAEVDAQTDRGETPLHRAVANGNPAVAARLLDLGADPTLRDDSGSVADPVNCENWNTPTFFRIAAADVVAGCIADGADVNASTQQSRNVRTPGSTPLHLASEAGRDTAVISLLLGAGAAVQARDSRNYSPLHKAAEGGTPSVVRALLQAGAEVDARAKGFSVDYGWDWTPLHLAAWQNADPQVAGALLAAGADLHARGDAGQTPLHQAALNENPAIAALLLEARADVNAKGSTGRTPLHEAAGRNPNPAVLAVLLDAGAELEARGVHPESHQRYGSLTPLHEAARTNANPEIVTALIEAGADVDGRVTDAAIPFRMVGSGATLVAELEGATPLHMAAVSNRYPAVIEALVRGGADLELRGRFGQTALHMAAMQNAAVFPVLLRLGADPAALDDEGKTPMDYARENGALQGLEEVRRLRGTPGASVPQSP